MTSWNVRNVLLGAAGSLILTLPAHAIQAPTIDCAAQSAHPACAASQFSSTELELSRGGQEAQLWNGHSLVNEASPMPNYGTNRFVLVAEPVSLALLGIGLLAGVVVARRRGA